MARDFAALKYALLVTQVAKSLNCLSCDYLYMVLGRFFCFALAPVHAPHVHNACLAISHPNCFAVF